jgi:hypothetical protein
MNPPLIEVQLWPSSVDRKTPPVPVLEDVPAIIFELSAYKLLIQLLTETPLPEKVQLAPLFEDLKIPLPAVPANRKLSLEQNAVMAVDVDNPELAAAQLDPSLVLMNTPPVVDVPA